MRTASYLIAALVFGLALTLGPIPARAETTSCTPITAVPFVITVQGIYCFTQHLSTSMTIGFAIEIQTNSVVLDLNGFMLDGLDAGPETSAWGIHADNRQNITLKNGTVRGFSQGIYLKGHGQVVEEIRAEHNRHIGIWVEGGPGNLVRNNHVITTGTVVATGGFAGILVQNGNGSRVLNNDVIDVLGPGSAGVRFDFVSGALAVNNRITNADLGILYFSGVGGKYRDNLTTGVTNPFVGGTPVGIND